MAPAGLVRSSVELFAVVFGLVAGAACEGALVAGAAAETGGVDRDGVGATLAADVDGVGCAVARLAAGVDGVDAAVFPFATPPWPLHAPRPPLSVEPSLHVTFVGVAADLEGVDVAGAAVVAAVAAGALLLELAFFDAVLAFDVALFSTPPCPLQAPRPDADEVPSLQVTCVGCCARTPGTARTANIARLPNVVVSFRVM